MKNKYFILIAIALIWCSQLTAQVAITTDGSNADPSAMLDVKSSTKGVLITRLTTTQRNAIVSPAHSLVIFNTTTNCLEAYNATNSTWEQVYCLACDPPGAAGTISGTTPVCASQTGVSYSIPAISGATGYVWAYSGTGFSIASGSNTNSITADFSSATAGNLTVYGTNSCGNGTVSANYAISVTAIPGAPTAGTHTPSETQIVWNWNTVSGATGYKYNSVNDYGTATDNAGSTTYTQTGLTCNTAYTLYVWAYNACGNSSATTLNQATSACGFSCGGTLIDSRDAQSYSTVQIGSQCWMAENLNIGTMVNGSSNQTNNAIIEKYCYDNSTTNCDTYGGLYQWNEAMQYVTTEGTQGICPDGWHFPTDAEWMTLEEEVESTSYVDWNTTGWRGTDAGGNLKETGTSHWLSPNTGATNSSGFTGLPAGFWYADVSFNELSFNNYFWTSSEDGTQAWYRHLYYGSAQVHRSKASKAFYGFSVRCLRD